MKLILPCILILAMSASTIAADVSGEKAFSSYFRMYYKRALASYKTALKNAESTADLKKQVLSLNNIASVFYGLGVVDSTKAYLELAKERASSNYALSTIVQVNSTLLQGGDFLPVGSQLDKIKDSLSGNEYYSLLTAVGRLRMARNQPDQAIELLEKAFDYFKGAKLNEGAGISAYYLGKARAQAGKTVEALAALDESLNRYRAAGYTHGIRKALELKESLYRKKGDNATADQVKQQLERMAND